MQKEAERPPTPEEVYEALKPKTGEQVARALVDFVVLAGQRMPTISEAFETYKILRTFFEAREAQLLISHIMELAERKHRRPLSLLLARRK